MCARLSMNAYLTKKDFRKIYTKDWDNVTMFSEGGTECYVLSCDKNYVVVFRGTEPTSWEDIKADVSFLKSKREWMPDTSRGIGSKGKIHSGFRHALNDIWKTLWEHYQENGLGKQLVVTGHSLGAALATLYTDRINDSKSVCYTYGSPRVGNKELIKNMNFNCYRIRNNNDIVTKVPPEFLGFTHKSTELKYFDINGKLKEGFSRWYMFTQWIKGTFKGLLKLKIDGFSDHSMDAYYELCKKEIKK
tara:strand:- start:74 stop:814 length:741 start_codon:yes stop_codon:yes gene_type:complete